MNPHLSSIEPLESRIAPATFTVTTTADAGAGSLRQAILDANATTDADIIAFAIAGGGVQTIAPLSPLPQITQPLTVDGTTQAGYVAGSPPVVELNGAGAGVSNGGLEVTGADVRIVALTVNRFAGAGIFLGGIGGSVEGSFLGTDAAGTGAAGNGFGISIAGSQSTIGGATAGLGNLISGNTGAGILLAGSGVTENLIQGNTIGLNFGLTAVLPNGVGITFDAGAHDNLVGGVATGAGNTISSNTGDGVRILQPSQSVRNGLLGNAIFGNGGLGIDLGDNDVTANSADGHQNFPVITEALYGGGRTLIRGTLTMPTAPSTAFPVQFFGNSVPDASGFGEGQQFFGATFVTTDSTGVATFSATVPFEALPTALITATAIDLTGNTSEFSATHTVASGVRQPTIAANGRSATFTDADGDRVTVLVSKGRLDPADFTLVAAGSGSGAQLLTLNLADDGAEFSGANITIVAKRSSLGGDGFVNLGHLNAAGVNLGVVKISGDLGRIDVGSGPASATVLRALSVQSLGRYGGDTDLAGSPPDSTINGTALSISIAGDLIGAALAVSGDLDALSIRRNVIGTDTLQPGLVFVQGILGRARIGGDLNGGDTASTGSITAALIRDLTIGGSLLGGLGNGSGSITVGTGGIGRLAIAGRLLGNPDAAKADLNAAVRTSGPIGTVTVGGDLVGGSADNSAYIFGQRIGAITVGGALKGGAGFFAGGIDASTTIGTATIRGSLFGGAGERSGGLYAATGLGRVSVGGSLEGGAGTGSATIDTGGGITSVSIGGSTREGAGIFSGSITATARIGSVAIKGSLITSIASQFTIGSVSVGGDFFGLVGARGAANPATAAGALAIGKVTVGGNFSGSILAGWDYLTGWANPDVTIGAISIGGNAGTVQVSAGVDPGPNGTFADGDDRVVNGGGNGLIASQIASIVVRGQVGRSDIGSHLGFTAQQIGKLQIGATKFPLTAGTDRFDLGILGNVSLREA